VTVRAVAVNLLWLVPDDVGGSEQSTVASLRALAELDPPDLAVSLCVLEPFVDAHPDVVQAFRTDVLRASGRSRVARVLSEARWLPGRTAAADLVHHAGGTAPPRSRRPYVLTLHDLQPLEATATHSWLKRTYLALVVPRALRRASRVIVPSAFVRASVLERTGLDPTRVVVVPHGVAVGADPTPPDVLRDRYDLRGRVVLYPAITYPHKDHQTLVESFVQVVERHPDALLVLTGRPDSAEAEVMGTVERLGLADRVRRLGRVPAADMAGLYDLAEVVAVPSRYEGFGLPAAEAMAHGVAVVAADATALPEVVGDAGALVPPGDVAAWGQALSDLLQDPDRRAALAEAGRARAQASFGWSANARGLAEVYRQALAGR
jgi:alpha-1,3-rhamnosyl/mannosyltransferase